MAMDSARRSAGNIDFVKFLLQPAGIAGWKFQSAQERGGKSKVGLVLDRDRVLALHIKRASGGRGIMKHNALEQNRNVANPGLVSSIDRKSFRPFEFTINDRKIKLESETIIDAVTGNQLRNRAVFLLPGRVRYLPTI
jgi:hypothetical protein